jgi:DNA repair protein NreA
MELPKKVNKKELLATRSQTLFKIREINGEFNSATPPAVFVGSKLRYPAVNVGILSPPEKEENAWLFDAQNYWAEKEFKLEDVIRFRRSLINSRFQSNIHAVNSKKSEINKKFLEISQELSMAVGSVDLELELKKKAVIKLDFDKINMPQGPRAELKGVKLTENPKIPKKIDKVVSDIDLKSVSAINTLYKKQVNEHSLSKLLSMGMFGLKKDRRLVPTRWSITATDDIIGKNFLSKIRYYPHLEEYKVFYGNFFGNYYLIILLPGMMSYELFEMYLPNSAWSKASGVSMATDNEEFYGRKTYASNTVGGYYAARLAVLEYLEKIKKQSSVLVLRFETPEYWASMGVWVVRAAARKSLQSIPQTFDNLNSTLNYSYGKIKKNFNFDITNILKISKILNRKQMPLTKFIS